MGVCCIPSLALIRGSSFSPMARHGIRSLDRERARVRVNKIFAWFNFRWCAQATKIKQREKLKGKVYLTRKFPDLRYFRIYTPHISRTRAVWETISGATSELAPPHARTLPSHYIHSYPSNLLGVMEVASFPGAR